MDNNNSKSIVSSCIKQSSCMILLFLLKLVLAYNNKEIHDELLSTAR